MISGKLHIHTHLFFDSVTSHCKHFRIKYYPQNIILNLPNKALTQNCQKKSTYLEICYLIHLYASFLFANIFYIKKVLFLQSGFSWRTLRLDWTASLVGFIPEIEKSTDNVNKEFFQLQQQLLGAAQSNKSVLVLGDINVDHNNADHKLTIEAKDPLSYSSKYETCT